MTNNFFSLIGFAAVCAALTGMANSRDFQEPQPSRVLPPDQSVPLEIVKIRTGSIEEILGKLGYVEETGDPNPFAFARDQEPEPTARADRRADRRNARELELQQRYQNYLGALSDSRAERAAVERTRDLYSTRRDFPFREVAEDRWVGEEEQVAKIEHLFAAAENLEAAGMYDKSAELRQQAEIMQAEFEMARELQEVMEEEQGLEREYLVELEGLHVMVAEMREEVHGLRQQVEELRQQVKKLKSAR